ncbi:hypothetical protein AVEN_196081-1 [Araneus ventricosus]|uniref:Uncharacterized protein n=1 Tax=Araneus ventricosus TaxID=182803 RepID=A0A4Y2LSB5_ARAVE|nr:hypothetical protein AVEN_196081-1 [Araneus ventricosus]
MPIPRGCLPKSELIRYFKSELITQLSSVLRSLKPSSRLLMQVLRPSVLASNIPFYSPPQVMEIRPSFTSLDNRTPGLPTAHLPNSQWSTPIMGRFLGFATTGLFRDDTKRYR